MNKSLNWAGTDPRKRLAMLRQLRAAMNRGASGVQDTEYAARVLPATEWHLTFSDEFIGPYLDSTKWDTHFYDGARTGYPPDPHGGEWQYYTDEDVYIEGGHLRLRAQKRDYVVGATTWHYTSGMISGHAHFWQKYGKFECRCKMPQGVNGFWPAFWLVASIYPVHVWPPEIDVMEQFSTEDGYRTTHTANDGSDNALFESFPTHVVADVSQWHIYGVEWSPTLVIFTLDGEEVGRTTVDVNDDYAMYVIANLAVDGGVLDPPHHAPDANTPWPSYMDIDYIRVYSRYDPPITSFLANVSLDSNGVIGGSDRFSSMSGIGISASSAAALGRSGYGLAINITNTTNRYAVKDVVPPDSGLLRFRFYIDPNSLTMADGSSFECGQIRLSDAPYNLVAFGLGYTTADGYSFSADYSNDAGWVATSGAKLITDAPHFVEVYIRRATTNAASDGAAVWWLDGVRQSSWWAVDNYDSFELISGVWLGPDYGLDVGTSGTIFYDELKINTDGILIGAV